MKRYFPKLDKEPPLLMPKGIGRSEAKKLYKQYLELWDPKSSDISKLKRGDVIFDVIMTLLTGGFWLVWVLIRYLRTH